MTPWNLRFIHKSKAAETIGRLYDSSHLIFGYLEGETTAFSASKNPTLQRTKEGSTMTKPTTMRLFTAAVIIGAFVPTASARVGRTIEDPTEIVIESFDDARHAWKVLNDPVMGGRSTGAFSIQDGLGVFEGEVVDVPFLRAPGFIQARTAKSTGFPDVSSCSALKLVLKTNESYDGYRVSFGNKHAEGGKRHAFGFKADLEDVPVDDFGDVVIPFSRFTDFWDDATGDAIKTCEEDGRYCPDEQTLQDMRVIGIWGEGVSGKVSLEIKSISAVGCGE